MKTHAIRSDFDLRFLGFRVSIYGLGFSGFRGCSYFVGHLLIATVGRKHWLAGAISQRLGCIRWRAFDGKM